MLRRDAPSRSESEEKSEGNSEGVEKESEKDDGEDAADSAGEGPEPVEAKRAWLVDERRMDWEERMVAAPILLPEEKLVEYAPWYGLPLALRLVPNCLVLATGLACRGIERLEALENICTCCGQLSIYAVMDVGCLAARTWVWNERPGLTRAKPLLGIMAIAGALSNSAEHVSLTGIANDDR